MKNKTQNGVFYDSKSQRSVKIYIIKNKMIIIISRKKSKLLEGKE